MPLKTKAILLVLIFLPVLLSPAIGVNNMKSPANKIVNTTKEVPIEFSHTEDFSVSVDANTIEATEFNGSEYLDNLQSFNQTGISAYTGADVIPGSTAAIPGSGDLSYLTINITESYIYSDNDLGDGEIYYKIWANGNYTRYPESSGITASDGDTLELGTVGFAGWTWNDSVIVEV